MRFVWGVIKRWCVVAITASMMSSCGASWHLKRAIAKDPTIAKDTIVRVDTTIVTNEIRVVDTLVVRDTITREIVRGGARVRIQRIHDTIRVDVVCPPDTIRVIAEVPIERLIYKEQPPKRSLLDQLGMILFLILLITIALMVSRFLKGI
jgi:hypothetical protein